ncbi:hypothetical protein [Brevibacillus reuszeri]|nr:hypothetical protein [Brevibacillus reuszeri]
MAERQRVRLAVFFSIPIATGASGEYYIVKDKGIARQSHATKEVCE